jgi:hypothetical protein
VDPELLTGQTIHVYWPDDKMFYEGVVGSYKAKTGKHQVRPPRPPPPGTSLYAHPERPYPRLAPPVPPLPITWWRRTRQVDYFDGNKETLDLETQRIKLPRAVFADKWGLPASSAAAAAALSRDAMAVARFYTAGACGSPQLNACALTSPCCSQNNTQ